MSEHNNQEPDTVTVLHTLNIECNISYCSDNFITLENHVESESIIIDFTEPDIITVTNLVIDEVELS